MHAAAWVIGTVLLAVALCCVVGNIVLGARSLIYKERYSLIPLIGGVFGCVGMVILPLNLKHFCWLPLVLDLGTWTVVAGLLYRALQPK